MISKSVVRADFLLPLTDDSRIEDGYVLYEGSTIKEAGKYTNEIGARIIQHYGKALTIIGGKGPEMGLCIPKIHAVILPGFVKAHGHDHEATIIGLCKDKALVEWLDGVINPFTGFLNENREELIRKFRKSPNLIAYLKARLDDITYGITTCLTHHCNFNKYHVAELVQANVIAGTKMIIAVGSQDRNYDPRCLDVPHTTAITRLNQYLEQFGSTPRTWIIPGPDQLFSNGPEILQAQRQWALEHAHGKLIHMHSSEERNTTRWFKGKYGMTEVAYAESIGFLDENTMLAHQVHTTDEDLIILQRTKAKVVHNPLANTVLGSGMPPIVKMMEMGIPVAISTDGSGSADNQNILAAARLAVQYQRALFYDAHLFPAIKALQMITKVPAEMMHLNCGQIAPGFDADLTIIDLNKPNLVPTHIENVAENLIWASDGSEVRWVIANGVLIKDDYSVKTIDSAQVLSEIQELAMMYLEYSRTAKKVVGTGARQDLLKKEDDKPQPSK